jgi:hypothetical protein
VRNGRSLSHAPLAQSRAGVVKLMHYPIHEGRVDARRYIRRTRTRREDRQYTRYPKSIESLEASPLPHPTVGPCHSVGRCSHQCGRTIQAKWGSSPSAQMRSTTRGGRPVGTDSAPDSYRRSNRRAPFHGAMVDRSPMTKGNGFDKLATPSRGAWRRASQITSGHVRRSRRCWTGRSAKQRRPS